MQIWKSILLATVISVPHDHTLFSKSSSALQELESSHSGLQQFIPNLFDLLKDHLTFTDIANLNLVSREFNSVTSDFIKIARFCEPKSVYPDLVLDKKVLGDECLALFRELFSQNHKPIHFNSLSSQDWRIVLTGAPVTHLNFNFDTFTGLEDEFAIKAIEKYRGKVTFSNLPSLSSLSLSSSSSNKAIIIELFKAFGVDRISDLTVNNCNFEISEILDSFGEFLIKSQNSIQSVSFKNQNTDKVLEKFSFLSRSLKSIHFENDDTLNRGVSLNMQWAVEMSNLLSKGSIESISISDMTMGPQATNYFFTNSLRQVAAVQNLKILRWHGNFHGQLASFGEAVSELQSLRVISLTVPDIKGLEVHEIRGLSRNQQVLQHHINIMEMENRDFDAIVRAITVLPRLEDFSLNVRLNYKMAESLGSQISSLANLKSFSVSSIASIRASHVFSYEMMRVVKSLKSLKSLHLGFETPEMDWTAFAWVMEAQIMLIRLLARLQHRPEGGLVSLSLDFGKSAILALDVATIAILVGGVGEKLLIDRQQWSTNLQTQEHQIATSQTLKHLSLGQLPIPSNSQEWKRFSMALGKLSSLEGLSLKFKKPLSLGDKKADSLANLISSYASNTLLTLDLDFAGKYARNHHTGQLVPISNFIRQVSKGKGLKKFVFASVLSSLIAFFVTREGGIVGNRF